MNNQIPIFRFIFRFGGKSETAQAPLFSVPPPLRGRAENGNGVFRNPRPFPKLQPTAENAGNEHE